MLQDLMLRVILSWHIHEYLASTMDSTHKSTALLKPL